MYTEDVTNNAGGNRACTADCDSAQLRARGYEVKPVDDSGGVWEPLIRVLGNPFQLIRHADAQPQIPDHILTVYQPVDEDKEFIAKKVRDGSNELEMLRLLDTMHPKSDHVISLIDPFHGWAILPKMNTVEGYIRFAPNELKPKVSQVCLGFIKGLAYLHEHCIAHRDIKLDNLLLDRNFYPKIIDFDLAMQVEDEDEEVNDQCGTENWMAPEVEKKLWHSPIKADRWACGRVLLLLLDTFGKEEESLRAFARNLKAYNPRQRPSLLEWHRYSAPPFSGAGKKCMECQCEKGLAASTGPGRSRQRKPERYEYAMTYRRVT